MDFSFWLDTFSDSLMATAAVESHRVGTKRSYCDAQGDFIDHKFAVHTSAAAHPPPRKHCIVDTLSGDTPTLVPILAMDELPYGIGTSLPYAEGGNGQVHRCLDENRQLVAVKVADGCDVVEDELAALMLLNKAGRHPNICGFRTAFAIYGDVAGYVSKYAIVMDFYPGGNLHARLIKGGMASVPNRTKIATELLAAVDFCHKNGVLHADIKPSNITFDSKQNLKLCDFGSTLPLHRKYVDRVNFQGHDPEDFVTTIYYRSPEMLLRYLAEKARPTASEAFSVGRASDIWAVACTIIDCILPRSPLFWTREFDSDNNAMYGLPCISGSDELRKNRLLAYRMTQVLGYPQWPAARQVFEMWSLCEPAAGTDAPDRTLQHRLRASKNCSEAELAILQSMLSWKACDRPSTSALLAAYNKLE